jgi:hypothetical protein
MAWPLVWRWVTLSSCDISSRPIIRCSSEAFSGHAWLGFFTNNFLAVLKIHVPWLCETVAVAFGVFIIMRTNIKTKEDIEQQEEG